MNREKYLEASRCLTESAEIRNSRNRRRALKIALLRLNPHCFWCGEIVKDYGDTSFKETPRDTATIDHLIERPKRKHGDIVDKVLACMSCNSSRPNIYLNE